MLNSMAELIFFNNIYIFMRFTVKYYANSG